MFESGKVRELKTFQNSIDVSSDYMVGLYNGLEIAISKFERREPELKTYSNETKVIEGETNNRTKSGFVRR